MATISKRNIVKMLNKRIAEDEIDNIDKLKNTLIDVIDSYLEIVNLVDLFDKDGELKNDVKYLTDDLISLRKKTIKKYGPR